MSSPEGTAPPTAPLRVFVTGASGFLGRRIVAALTRRGHAVVALGRERDRLPEGPNVERRQVDLLDADRVGTAIEGCGAGVHAAGLGPGASALALKNANVEASRILAAACRRKGPRRMVAITSAVIEEQGDTEYRRSKTGQEAALRSYELELTVLRPTVVAGPWRESKDLARLVERLQGGRAQYLPGGGVRRIQPVHVDDVAAAAVAAAERPASAGAFLIVAGPEQGIRYCDFLGEIGRRIGSAARIRGVPLLPLRIAAALGSPVGAGAGIRASLDYYGRDHLYSLAPARKLLGYEPMPYEELFRRSFEAT